MNEKQLEDIIVIDIETVSSAENYEGLSERMKNQWDKKFTYLKNDDQLEVEDFYFQKAGIYAEFGKIVSIGLGIFRRNEDLALTLRVKSIDGHDEKKLLATFKTLLEEKFDNEKVKFCAHNGKEFDYPYLCRRMLVNDLSIPQVLNLRDRKPWENQHLDTLDMWKFGDRKSFTSLDLLTSLFGIPSSKTNLTGSQVNHVYYVENDLKKISTYCLQDVVATAQLLLKMNNMDAIMQSNVIFAPN